MFADNKEIIMAKDDKLKALDAAIAQIEKQFGKVSVLKNRRHNRMFIFDFFKNIGTCAISSFSLFTGRKLQLFK